MTRILFYESNLLRYKRRILPFLKGDKNNKMETPEYELYISLIDGYSFRHAMASIYKEINTANIVISEKGFYIRLVNQKKQALYEINVASKELAEYIYNKRDENGNKVKSFEIAFDTKRMYEATKTITKKDGITISIQKGQKIIVITSTIPKTKGSNVTNSNYLDIIPCQSDEIVDLPEYTNDVPFVKMPSSQFATICSRISSMKCNTVVITCYPQGITFEGRRNDGSLALKDSSGKIDGEVTLRITIPSNITKSLSKINNFAPPTTQLKFFTEGDNPLKILSPIGGYGFILILLKNEDV